MFLSGLVRVGLFAACILACQAASAQQGADKGFKEIQIGKNAFTVGDPTPAWVDQIPIPTTTSSQPVVIRLADAQYLLGKVLTGYFRRATLINDAAALTSAGRVSLSFAPEYERVQLHVVRIYRGQDVFDKTASSSIRFLQREQNLELGMYSGRVTASILIDDVRVGDTIEFAYTISGQNPVFGGKAFGLVGWDLGLPTAHRRVVLSYPAGRAIAWRVVGDRPMPALVPTETVKDGIRHVTFDEQPLPGLTVEAMTAPDFFNGRLVQYSEFAGWNDVIDWAGNLFAAVAPPDGEFRDIVKRIKALPSDEARTVAALELVQSQIRYFSVSLGESSHRPTAPDEVLRRRYGDCKDKSLLLIALLRELGVDSKPVLLQYGRHAGLDKTLPSPQFFDHVIVRASVGGRQYFLDPTRLGQHGALDKMGQIHEGAQVLVIARDNKPWSIISSGTTDVIGDEIFERATLARFEDEGKLELRRVMRGLAAERSRIQFERATRDQIRRALGEVMERRYPGAKLAGDPEIHNDPANNEFSITASYNVPKLATEIDGNWTVTYLAENLQNLLILSPSATRATPLRIPGFASHSKYNLEVTFPEQVSVSLDPRATTFANGSFNATVNDYFRGNVARKSVELKILRPSVDARDYPAYADDLRAMSKAIGNGFVINKTLLVAGDKPDLTHRLQDQRQEIIKKTTETIGGGKLSGMDLAAAYCLRANARTTLGQSEEALRDANAALKVAPTAAATHLCRASVYFETGQFEKSVTDYSNAIPLGPTDAGLAYRGRGISKVYAGHIQDAIEDFAKASEQSDVETRIYAEIWLLASYGRLHQPVPADFLKRAAAQTQGDWPHAGLAMMIGQLSPEDMLKSLDKKEGDEKQMALAEAYFYLGQHYLGAGDLKQAETSFEKTRSLGVIDYIEHISAKYELELLKNQAQSAKAAVPAKPAAASPVVAQ